MTSGFAQMVVPGTPRDSLYILDTLINIDAGPPKDKDAARLSPLGHVHLNVLGRHSISLNVLGRHSISSSTPAEGPRQLGEVPDHPGSGDLEEDGA